MEKRSNVKTNNPKCTQFVHKKELKNKTDQI